MGTRKGSAFGVRLEYREEKVADDVTDQRSGTGNGGDGQAFPSKFEPLKDGRGNSVLFSVSLSIVEPSERENVDPSGFTCFRRSQSHRF